jgi:signal transduction histidine kinase
LSHLLLLLVVVPLMGLALTYVAESQVLLKNLSTELQGQAVLLAEITGERTEVWSDAVQAQALVTRFDPHLGARLMLLDAHGLLLASSDPADAGQLGQLLQPVGWAEVVAVAVSVHTSYSRQIQGEIVDVLVPVVGSDQQVTGVVRLSQQLAGVSERFVHLRTLVAGVLAPWRESAQVKGLRWQADVPVDLPTLQSDPDRLAHAVGNLFSNAIKFMPGGGTVSVGAGMERGMAWIQPRRSRRASSPPFAGARQAAVSLRAWAWD